MATSSRPRRGAVAVAGTVALRRAKAARSKNGRWRPDRPFDHDDGIKITMRRERGVTEGDVLRVPFRFQVPSLGELTRSYRYQWSTYDTLSLGQRSRPIGQQLLELSVNTMLLDDASADAAEGIVVWNGVADPQAMINELRWIMGQAPGSEPQIFRLVLNQPAVWGDTPLINMLACLTSLDVTEKPDEIGTEYLSATFLQFKEDEVGRKQRPQKHGASKHKLRAGDTLYEIAKKSHFHQPSAWKKIAKANGITGVSPNDADELKAWAKRHHKTELKIPAK